MLSYSLITQQQRLMGLRMGGGNVIWGHQEAELTETDSLWPKHGIAFPFPWNWAGSVCGCKQSLSSSFHKAQEPEPWKLRGRLENAELFKATKNRWWRITKSQLVSSETVGSTENYNCTVKYCVFLQYIRWKLCTCTVCTVLCKCLESLLYLYNAVKMANSCSNLLQHVQTLTKIQ